MATLQIVQSIQRLVCTSCGAEANASCNCGKPYVPATERVREYDKANPGKSTRYAAADLGVSNKTVSQVRNSGVTQVTPDTVTGRDNKTYPAKHKNGKTPKPKNGNGPKGPGYSAKALSEALPTEAEADESYQETLYDQACLLLESMAGTTRQRFFAHLKEAYHGQI